MLACSIPFCSISSQICITALNNSVAQVHSTINTKHRLNRILSAVSSADDDDHDDNGGGGGGDDDDMHVHRCFDEDVLQRPPSTLTGRQLLAQSSKLLLPGW